MEGTYTPLSLSGAGTPHYAYNCVYVWIGAEFDRVALPCVHVGSEQEQLKRVANWLTRDVLRVIERAAAGDNTPQGEALVEGVAQALAGEEDADGELPPPLPPGYTVQIVEQGHESDNFWTLFEEGW